MRELLLVSLGSFFGGGCRYWVSKVVMAHFGGLFPIGTLAVNILGCLIIGFLSGLAWPGGWMNAHTKLLLTTGFCGGFTTFSTFANEGMTLLQDGHPVYFFAYLIGSVLLGLAAVFAGYLLSRMF